MNGQKNEDTRFLLLMAAIVIGILVAPFVYATHAGSVNGMLLTIARWELRPFIFFFEEAFERWKEIGTLAPEQLTWEEMTAILSYAGSWARWPLLVVLAVLGGSALFMAKTKKLTRSFSMESLLVNNAESFPCLCPVVGKGKYLLSKESFDAGPWRIARSPLQFAAEHGLLLKEKGNAFHPNEILRDGLGYADMPAFGKADYYESQAEKIFIEQLGEIFTSVVDLPPLRRALAAAFLAYAAGEKNTAISLLNAMSLAYVENNGIPSCPIVSAENFQNRCASVLQNHAKLLEDHLLIIHKGFQLPWFMALLTLARRKGVLAASQFLFVRPLDRPLWYALNQCGGRTAWVEAFAAWAHYDAEMHDGDKHTIATVHFAVVSLKSALDAQGWLKDKNESILVEDQNFPNDCEEFIAENTEEKNPIYGKQSSSEPVDDCSSSGFVNYHENNPSLVVQIK